MDFSGKQVAVIGYGKSGKAALELLGKLGAKRILYDQKLDCNAPGIDAEVLVSGDFKEEGWDDVDCAVFSPGYLSLKRSEISSGQKTFRSLARLNWDIS